MQVRQESRPTSLQPETVFVVGCGPSAEHSSVLSGISRSAKVIACNRAIEFVAADSWVWVDRIHFERSKWHPHARKACWVSPADQPVERHGEIVLYEPSRKLPCEPHQLFLGGGTLTVAAHCAVRLGAKQVVFVGCDAWSENRDRYHSWDGAPLTPEGLSEHRNHLQRTAAGIRELAARHPEVKFYDATEKERHLGIEPYPLLPTSSQPKERPKMSKKAASPRRPRVNRIPQP